MFLWSEALLIVGVGALCGTAIGFAVAEVLVKVLSGVFDPPPAVLSVPWPYLLGVMGTAAACTAIAVLTLRSLAARSDPYVLKRD